MITSKVVDIEITRKDVRSKTIDLVLTLENNKKCSLFTTFDSFKDLIKYEGSIDFVIKNGIIEQMKERN